MAIIGCTGFCCPCVLFGHNVETMREDIPWTNACVCHAMCTAFFHGIHPKTSFLIFDRLVDVWHLHRQSLQKKYHLKNSPCDPCLVHCCMHWCALCQEHREMRNHFSDNADMIMTVVNPPPAQQMNSRVAENVAV